ncbi:uncharacterized protein LOC112574724 [Pomacea canaliculata]|uniref:uncharacterized protein LOC112574724 n=1 Tax=Pomacea canaliculata TaxID=400727 RepID=UPI000D72FC45|nr:uncharacterized protein LOC112574724 [Pomacea canaliculata]
MSVHSPSSSIEDELRKRARIDKEDSTKKSTGPNRGGGRARIYLHAVSDAQADLLKNTGYTQPLQEVKKKTGADVQFDSNPSSVPGMKILVIRGVPTQIEAAVRLISQMTNSQGALVEEAQTFWLQWVEAAFPELDSRAYFLPPVYFNRVPMTRQSVVGQDVLVLQAAHKLGSSVSTHAQDRDVRNDAAKERVDGQNLIQAKHVQDNQCSQPKSASFAYPTPPTILDSDIRDDAALQCVLINLQKLSERKREVFVGLSQLQFGQYLGEPCYAAAAAQLPIPANLPPSLPRNWKQGDFDILFIHRQYGLVICEVKAFGNNVKEMNMSQQDIDNNIRKKLRDAVSQLDKAEAMLSHLVSDIAPGLRITKTIAVPNLTAQQVQQAISCDAQLIQELCRCLGTTSDPADITGLCLCRDLLSDPKTLYDVSSHVLKELGHWWQRRMAVAGPDFHMTLWVYKALLARFCGPATTVSVPCTCPPRVI